MFDLAKLDAALAGTVFAGKLHFSPLTDSTNIDAMTAAQQGAPHGSVYLADEQRAGRGRADHRWHSAAGEGLYVSVLLRLPLPAASLPLAPLAVGLATASAIHAVTGLTADLRWPNDILIGTRKIVGILVETKSSQDEIPFMVAGIGINVHQRAFTGGPALSATSLDLEAGGCVDRQALLTALLKSLEREARGLLDAEAAAAIPRRVEAASTWIRGRRVAVHGPQACTGVTAGLDEHGFLRVRTASEVITVLTGGIRAAEAKAGGTN